MASESTDTPTEEASPLSPAQAIEEQRDLRAQITELDGLKRAEKRGILFKVTTDQEEMHRVWSMVDGAERMIPDFAIINVMNKRIAGTNTPQFTATKERAPEFIPGKVKCFLHEESDDREALEKIGLAGHHCRKANLVSAHAKRMHGMHRHKQEWAALQDFYDGDKEAKAVDRAERQLEATLELARAATGQATATPVVTEETLSCGLCEYIGTEAQLRKHQAKHKKE